MRGKTATSESVTASCGPIFPLPALVRMPEKKTIYSPGFLDGGLSWLYQGMERKKKELRNSQENDGPYSCKPSLFLCLVALSIL